MAIWLGDHCHRPASQEIRNLWAKALGVSGPQWMILMALAQQDQGQSVP